MDDILEQLKKLKGKVSFYYKSLYGLDELKYEANIPLSSPGIIKLPVLVEVFQQIHEKKLQPHEKITITTDRSTEPDSEKGLLKLLHNEIELTLYDLCTLMIVADDDTAADILINLVGIDHVNHTIKSMGLKTTRLHSLLCHPNKSANLVSLYEIGYLLERIHSKTLISASASEEMQRILKNQMFGNKLPFLLPKNVEVAHVVSEYPNSVFDIGIVYTRKPFILCLGGFDVNVLEFTYVLQNIALELFIRNKNIPSFQKN